MTRREIEKEVARAANESRAKHGVPVPVNFPFAEGWMIAGYMIRHRTVNPTKGCDPISPKGHSHSMGSQCYTVSFFYDMMNGLKDYLKDT